MTNPTTQRVKDYLPDHIGSACTRELSSLLEGLTPSFKRDYLLQHIFSKYVGEDTLPAEDRYQAAITKWLNAEDTNACTNQRLLLEEADFAFATSDEVLSLAAKYIAEILKPLDLDNTLKGANHTGGASTRVKRGVTAQYLKYTGKAHVSSSALKHWFVYAANTQLSDQVLEVQESSVLFTVPKSSIIDRVAAKEPEINMILQRSVGNLIRKRLLRAGCNLNDQSINKNLARDALRLKLGTIDLSSASDRISTQLVFRLLPLDWFWLLDDLRVKSTLVGGKEHDLHMFSSMGNGFTFELESLIFFALTRAVCKLSGVKGKVSVYGDDIIAPSRICARLARTFEFFGFKVNESKSFWSGYFRESCGGHYHHGYDVTPFYIRGPIRSISGLIRLLNQLCKWDRLVFSDTCHHPFAANSYYFCTKEVAEFHQKWKAIVPSTLHGGQDVESSTSLVTGDLPRKRLCRKTETIPFTQRGGLLWWLAEKERRSASMVGGAILTRLDSDIVQHLCCDPRRELYHFVDDELRRGSETPWDLYGSLV